MKLALATQMGSLILNFVQAPLLVLGWPFWVKLGGAGAGLETLLAGLAATVVLSLKLARSDVPLHFPLAMMKPQAPVWKRVLVIGLPAGGEFILMSFYLLLIYWSIQRFGAQA